MKIKDYDKEYVFIKKGRYYDYELIPTDKVIEYMKENKLVFCKIYGTKKSDWLDDVESYIKQLIITRGENEGIDDIEDRLDFENEDYKKSVEYLQKFIDKANENIYVIDFDVEIELIGTVIEDKQTLIDKFNELGNLDIDLSDDEVIHISKCFDSRIATVSRKRKRI